MTTAKEQADVVGELRAEVVRLGREAAIWRALAVQVVVRVREAGMGALAALMADDVREVVGALDEGARR